MPRTILLFFERYISLKRIISQLYPFPAYFFPSIMVPHSTELTYKYRLYAFATYQDRTAAKSKLAHVVLAKEFNQIKPIEADHYVEHIGGTGATGIISKSTVT
ncbi:hypothetical protein [Pontibacter pudoricolor]|uniref:hypothetical protein n=1 Tax=Pontibacter pudoricolor TaxID=2694930 RepID=UPI0013917C03|nr:hypothetical protein [Pontibacter pudoricolor]